MNWLHKFFVLPKVHFSWDVKTFLLSIVHSLNQRMHFIKKIGEIKEKASKV